jgi:hypothetical protein
VGLTAAHFAGYCLAAFQLRPLMLQVRTLVSAPTKNIIQQTHFAPLCFPLSALEARRRTPVKSGNLKNRHLG